MEAVVLVDQNWAIGRGGDQIVRIKADLKRFRELTADGILIYGRKTMLTFPGAKPLPGRENWILSRNRAFEAEEALIFHDLPSLLEAAGEAEEAGRKLYLIGGASVYEALLPYCDVCHVTEVDKTYEGADCYFPRIDRSGQWHEVWRSERFTAGRKEPFTFSYVRYERL